MKPISLRSLSLLSIGLALSVSAARADDPARTPTPAPAAALQAAPAQHERAARIQARMRARILSRLTGKLSLNADQQARLIAILGSAQQQAAEVRGNLPLTQGDALARLKEIRAASRGQIRAILTPDQQARFDALRPHGGLPPAAAR